jgi:hypothetical protein
MQSKDEVRKESQGSDLAEPFENGKEIGVNPTKEWKIQSRVRNGVT